MIRTSQILVALVGFLILASLSVAAVDTRPLRGLVKAGRRNRSLEGLVTERVAPHWPPEPRMLIRGDVLVLITLDEMGSLRSARAISGHALQKNSAIVAIRQWKFRPMIQRGKARWVTGIVTVRFPLLPNEPILFDCGNE